RLRPSRECSGAGDAFEPSARHDGRADTHRVRRPGSSGRQRVPQALELVGGSDLLYRADHDHAPAQPRDRVDPVDLERDALGAQQRRQLRPFGRPEEDRLRSLVEDVEHRPDQGRPPGLVDGDTTGAPADEQTYALLTYELYELPLIAAHATQNRRRQGCFA